MASAVLKRISSPCGLKFITGTYRRSGQLGCESAKLLTLIGNSDNMICVHSQLRKLTYYTCIPHRPAESFGQNYLDCKRYYSVELDSTDVQGRSLDKKVYFLMEKWYLEDAVDLIKRAAGLGFLPSGNTTVSLLKSLAEVGDIENAIELTDIILEHHLVLKKNVLPHLSNAFYNSGQIEDGIEYMELKYNATKKFEDIETLFALIATLTFREFPDKSDLIENLVNECAEEEKIKGFAHLWKCYMLAEQFEKAETLLEANKKELKSLLPLVINEICQMKDKVKVDREVVMSRLCDLEDLSKKQRAYAYETLLSILDSKGSWKQLLDTLIKACDLLLPVSGVQVNRHIKNLEAAAGGEMDNELLRDMNKLKEWAKLI